MNSLDESRLHALFSDCVVLHRSLVGGTKERTNALSAASMRWSGNPYGNYSQEENGGQCHAPVLAPAPQSWLQKLVISVAFRLDDARRPFLRALGNWIYLLFEKKNVSLAIDPAAARSTQ